MRKTKNQELLDKIVHNSEMINFFQLEAIKLYGELQKITLTKTEKERYADSLDELTMNIL